MSTVEPGTRLADRFRLEDRVSESHGTTLWKAIDEILARPVAVHTFDPEFSREQEVVTAARAASRLTDPRVTQVFDAADDDGTAYVVSEWVTGESLLDLLENGPLDPERGAALVAEAAEAVAHAHEAGLAHLNLTPARLIWTAGSTVKLLGVGVDAAILGLTSEDPVREDAEGLGRLLYAALTGHWPGPEDCDLPPAPLDDDRLCTPRQVTAGVPGYLDAIACRILPTSRRGQTPLTTPADIAEALAEVPRPAPVPASATPPSIELRSEGVDTMSGHMRADPTPAQRHAPPPRRGMFGRFVITVFVLLVMGVVGVAAWTLGKTLGSGSNATGPSASPSASTVDQPKSVKVSPAGATGFDPLGDNEERNELAAKAVDSSGSSDWHTESYDSAQFGRLKNGVGLLVDLGKPVAVTKLTVDFGPDSGGKADIRLGDDPSDEALKTVKSTDETSGKVSFDLSGTTPARYLLVWFTELPKHEGRYRGTILDLDVQSDKA